MRVSDHRRENVRRLIKEAGGPAALATQLGYRNASFLVQMAGPHPTRDVTEKSARSFEASLGMPEGALDLPPVDEPAGEQRAYSGAARSASRTEPDPHIAELIRHVGRVLDAEKVSLPAAKFADLVAMVYNDTVEHQGKVREEHILNLVRLVK